MSFMLCQYDYVNYNLGIDIFLHWSKLANDMFLPATSMTLNYKTVTGTMRPFMNS